MQEGAGFIKLSISYDEMWEILFAPIADGNKNSRKGYLQGRKHSPQQTPRQQNT